MLPFRHIVYPVDYSAACRAVVPYVEDMVAHFSADLTLAHAGGFVLEPLAYSAITAADPDWQKQWRATEEARLKEFAADAFPNQRVTIVLQLGDPGAVIHKVVQDQRADLVMLPTHGLGPVRRLLLGSVTAKVLHDVSTPVWTGAHSALTDHEPKIPYRSILCALESAAEGEATLRVAAALAESYQAQLSLVHVVETPYGSSHFDFRPYKKDLMDSAGQWLREMKGTLGLDVPHAVIDGDAPDGIRQIAVEKNADLVVCGRGDSQTAFGRIWSRLYPIIREAPCPVLSI